MTPLAWIVLLSLVVLASPRFARLLREIEREAKEEREAQRRYEEHRRREVLDALRGRR